MKQFRPTKNLYDDNHDEIHLVSAIRWQLSLEIAKKGIYGHKGRTDKGRNGKP